MASQKSITASTRLDEKQYQALEEAAAKGFLMSMGAQLLGDWE